MAISPDLFKPLTQKETATGLIRPSTTYWQDAWRRLKQNRLAMFGLAAVLVITLVAIFGPMLSPYSYSDQDFSSLNEGPGWKHWFGTDNLGRDLFTRVLYGARISLFIGVMASAVTLGIGVLYGGISGYVGGRLDELMMRFVDILYSIPFLLWIILLRVVFYELLQLSHSLLLRQVGAGMVGMILALALVFWLQMARIVRGQILSLKEQEYILAAHTIGASRRQILLRHLIPNSMGPIIVTVTLSIPEAIFTEAFLSFLGLGVAAPRASWGVLASDALTSLKSYPHQLFFPALAICVTLLAFNFLGDGLRDALDPRMSQ